MATKRTSTEDKIINGVFQPSKHGNRSDGIDDTRLYKPPEVTGEAAKYWRDMGPRLEADGRLKYEDRLMFTQLCQAVKHYKRIASEINKLEKTLAKTTDLDEQFKIHKMIGALQTQWKQVISILEKLSRSFGLTPYDRGAIDIKPVNKKNADPFFG